MVKMANQVYDVVLPDQGDNIIRTKEADYSIDPKGIAHQIFVALNEHKDTIGQIEAETGKEETFGTTLEKSIRIACHLRRMGVTPDDIVTLCSTNHLDTTPVFYAILFIGAKNASLDPFAPDDDRTRQIKHVQPKFIFATEETVNALEKMINSLEINTKIIVFGETDKHIPFKNFLVPLSEEESKFTPYEVKDVRETAFIVFSSGTTGHPKAVCISNYASMALFGAAPKQDIPTKDSLIYLCYATLCWATAVLQMLLTTICGKVKIQATGFEPKKVWRDLEKYKVSCFSLSYQDAVSLVKAGKPKGLQLPHLKTLVPAGGSLSKATLLKLREMFPTTFIYIVYGQIELWNAPLKVDPSPEAQQMLLNHPNICGRPVKGSTYKIVDLDTGKILGPNQPGELCVKSDDNMNGYYKEDFSDRFDEDNFLKTGDILYYNEDKWFFFVERCKEMLRYKLTTIAPTELEHILLEHPSVKLAVVIGKPTDEGDLATAVIVKKDDNVTAKELEDLVASKVDDRKKLRGGVYFVKTKEIPFTPSGKVKRVDLKRYILKKCKCRM